jgi:hypothetical protein
VWLARAHLSLLRDRVEEILKDEAFVQRIVGVHGNGTGAGERLEAVVSLWNAARPTLAFSPEEHICWPSDNAEDSVIPRGTDPSIITRLDALAHGLELRRTNSRVGGTGSIDILCDCARDTLALAAALSPDQVFILTTIAPGRNVPDLVSFLAAAEVPCCHVEDLGQRRLLRESLSPLFTHAGLVELLATGSIRLACLHLIVPRALLAAPENLSDDEYAYDAVCDEIDATGDPSLWDDATSAWWELP